MKPLLSTLILFSLLLSFQNATNAQPGPDIIFDTDLGGDADDLGALSMLHHYVEQGNYVRICLK